MDHQNRDLVSIVRLEPHKPRGIRIFSRPDHANETQPLRPVLGQKSRSTDRKIGRKGITVTGN